MIIFLPLPRNNAKSAASTFLNSDRTAKIVLKNWYLVLCNFPHVFCLVKRSRQSLSVICSLLLSLLLCKRLRWLLAQASLYKFYHVLASNDYICPSQLTWEYLAQPCECELSIMPPAPQRSSELSPTHPKSTLYFQKRAWRGEGL